MKQQPNVILIITDDQGYGDLGCTGNPWVQTPNIDRFSSAAFRFTDFHVSPLCTPTRGAVMTGHRPVRNGAWATCWGRSICRKTETTMAEVFKANGYKTGMFGKWHLGDNYPYRPEDRGFEHVVAHRGGGVGQTPDYWGNNYFDDTYFHNSEPMEHQGYCTDIWFDEALKFVEDNKEAPFFAYIATNAPHSPYLVAEKYRNLYKDNPDIPEPAFYGMITNIDENFEKLRKKLSQLDLEDNTVLIFMTDNGSSGGCLLDNDGFVTSGYNAGLRGMKASYYDGGHRVPFFIRWPAGGIDGGKDIEEMALHVDLLPTFIDLCGLDAPRTNNGTEITFDGTSVAPLLTSSPHAQVQSEREKSEQTERKQQTAGNADTDYKDRVHFIQYRQNTDPPEKWTNAVITPEWRLIRGKELYNIKKDPGQKHDVASEYPETVRRLRNAHEKWWEEIEPNIYEYSPISLGNDTENPTRLDSMDVMGDVAWHQTHIIQAQRSTGKWTVDVEQPGTYRFSLRRWPEELDLPLDAGISPEEAKRHIYAGPEGTCRTIQPTSARISLFGRSHKQKIERNAHEVTFTLEVDETGVTEFEAWFSDESDDERGAYYVYVERLSS